MVHQGKIHKIGTILFLFSSILQDPVWRSFGSIPVNPEEICGHVDRDIDRTPGLYPGRQTEG